MKKILLYSPDVIGHPRVYCRVIADALVDAQCMLFVAMGFSEAAGFNDSPDLHPLAGRKNVQILDTRQYSSKGLPHLTAEELVGLQTSLNIDTTLFIEADKSNNEFRRIAAGAAPRLHGRNLGIFAATSEWYPGEDSFTGAPRTLRAATLRTTLGNIKRALFNRKQSLRYFYENIVIGKGILHELLVKDERLAAWCGEPVYWMPEISRPAAAAETPAEAAEFLVRQQELNAFLATQPQRERVLYFGDAAYYKGYDLFLQFVAENPSLCGIHAGRTYDAQQQSYFKCDVSVLRKQLQQEGRLFETNAYVHTQRLKELYFGAIRLYITTHRLALSSSTVIQAAELGKPVLVPDRGLIGYRARNNGIGAVYSYEDLADLRTQAELMWQADLTVFSKPLAAFWQRFDDAAIKAFFSQRLLQQ